LIRKKNTISTKLRKHFISGVLVSTPIIVTIYLVWWIITTIDTKVKHILPREMQLSNYLPFEIPGVGIVVVFMGLTLIGALAKGFFGKYLLKIGEDIFSRMPVVRGIYGATKQISQAIFEQSSTSFKEVGMIEYPRKGLWSLCFITGATKGEVQKRTDNDVVNVFVPTTPNPTSGFLLFIPRKEIIIMDMTVEEGIKMVVSAGIVTPKHGTKNGN
jgi:uncharacterized membrane protein